MFSGSPASSALETDILFRDFKPLSRIEARPDDSLADAIRRANRISGSGTGGFKLFNGAKNVQVIGNTIRWLLVRECQAVWVRKPEKHAVPLLVSSPVRPEGAANESVKWFHCQVYHYRSAS
jgi:hypothetical protein